MNETLKNIESLKIEDMFIHIKSNIILKDGQSYLDYLFNSGNKNIKYEVVNFQQLDCFSSRYCSMFKYSREDYTKTDLYKLKSIVIDFYNNGISKEKIIKIDRNNNEYLDIVPIQNGLNEYVCFVPPKEIINTNDKSKIKLYSK